MPPVRPVVAAGFAAAVLGLLAAPLTPAAGRVAPGPAGSLLLVRGTDRSGGFLEAGDDAAGTERLADIANLSTTGGNHGRGQPANPLRDNGYAFEQITEAVELIVGATGSTEGVAVSPETPDLSVYDGTVFGSNNAVYNEAQMDAADRFVRGGGGALCISDAHFGGG